MIDRSNTQLKEVGLTVHCPAVWTDGGIRCLAKMASSYSTNLVLYGSLSRRFPTGRPNDGSETDISSFIAAFKAAKAYGCLTKYLLNGIINVPEKQEYDDYFDWVTRDLDPDTICISDPSLACHLANRYNIRNLAVSTIAGWKNPEDASPWINDDLLRNRLCAVSMHHDFALLPIKTVKPFTEDLKSRGIEPDVLVTESCSPCCPVRREHYAFFGKKGQTKWTPHFLDPFQVSCVLGRLHRPDTLLDLAGFIPPSRINSFADRTGIAGFKLSGRSMPTDWILNCLKYYVSRTDPTNIFDLIVFTTPFLDEMEMTSSDLFFLSSDAYKELYDELIEFPIATSDRRLWLQRKAAQFFEEGNLRINDPGAIYSAKSGVVRCVKPGNYARRLKTAMRKNNASSELVT